jgi:hypothetical protein
MLTSHFNFCKFKCNDDEIKSFITLKEEINHYSKLVKSFNSLSDD